MATPITRSFRLDDEGAGLLVQFAVEHAKSIGVRVAAVVTDEFGHLIAARRQPDAHFSTFNIAHSKAFTAVNFGVDTHLMAEGLPNQEFAIHLAQADDRIVFIKGGRVLTAADGELVGGIGVSGASADEDFACATAAIERWRAL